MSILMRLVSLLGCIGIMFWMLVSSNNEKQWTATGFATIGASLMILILFFSPHRILMGIAAIFGGTIGGILGDYEDFLSPEKMFFGAIIGASIWITLLSIIGYTKLCENRQEKITLYFIISLVFLIGGPLLGISSFIVEFTSIHPMDRYYYFLRLLIVCTIGGTIIGISYFLVWLNLVASLSRSLKNPSSPNHSTDNGSNENKQSDSPPQGGSGGCARL